MSTSEHDEAVWAGDEIPDVSRPCDRDGCPGTYRPDGRPHWDADGSASVGLVCDAGCGMQSAGYWGWEGGDHIGDEDEEDEDGNVRDVWADVDADLRRRGVIW